MSDSAADSIRVVCDGCGKAFRVPASKAGKRGKCPKCGAVLHVPEPVAAGASEGEGEMDWSSLAAAEAGAAPAEDGYDLSDDPALAAAKPVETAQVARKRAFAEQMKSLTPEQRKALANRAETLARGGKKAIDGDDQLWGFPSFLMGLTLAAVGALVGGAIWFGLLAATGRELRIAAWGVGLLAGGGMFAGYQKHDFSAGFLAACLAGAGIVGAKFAMVTFGQGYLVDNFVAEVASEAEIAIEQEYQASALDVVPLEEAREVARWYRIEEYRHDEGISDETWYGMLEFIRGRHEQPIYQELREANEPRVRELYARSQLQEEVMAEHLAAAEAAYRAEKGLPAADEEPDYWAELDEDATEAEWEAASQKAAAAAEEREAQWADFEPKRTEAVAAAWQELKTMPEAEVFERYDALREQRRTEGLAMLEEAEQAFEDLSDEEVEEAGLTAFGFHDLIFIPLALVTAFGVGTGLRGED